MKDDEDESMRLTQKMCKEKEWLKYMYIYRSSDGVSMKRF